MSHPFDKDYWDAHWQQAEQHEAGGEIAPNPYLARELGGLTPGTALDAGCGEGAEAIWLANAGWRVTAVDISSEALSRASARAANHASARERVEWIEADLSLWEPRKQFDLVTTHYAHPALPQLAFYQHIAGWVAPGGTLLIVGHRHTSPTSSHGHSDARHGGGEDRPAAALVTAASIIAGFDPTQWDIATADEPVRRFANREGRTVQLDDVVVRASRRAWCPS